MFPGQNKGKKDNSYRAHWLNVGSTKIVCPFCFFLQFVVSYYFFIFLLFFGGERGSNVWKINITMWLDN